MPVVVCLETTFLGELFTTKLTGKRFLTSVDHAMYIQFLKRFKFFITINVDAWQDFLALIDLNVVSQFVVSFWVFFTNVTLIIR